jgi:thiol-disulfide isomerase/thioredoxin
LVLGACATKAAPPVVVVAAEIKAPPAEEIIRMANAAYASARSYEDTGEVTTAFSGDHPFTEVKTFSTAFVRAPRKFRFEFLKGHDPRASYVIWSDGIQTFSRWYIKPKPEAWGENLEFALSAAAGVSSRTSYVVPMLLLASRPSPPFKRAAAVGLEVIDGHACWRVSYVAAPEGGTYTIWIDRELHVIRQIAERDLLDTGTIVDSLTAYHPTLDRPIALTRLALPDVTDAEVVQSATGTWVGLSFARDGGTRIREVSPGSPAVAAGFQIDDVVTHIDGEPTSNGRAAGRKIARSRAGTTLTFRVLRGQGTMVELAVVVTKRPDPRTFSHDQLIDKPAPAFAADLVTGPDSAKLADLAGHVVIVDFWATWCKPCRRSMPKLAALYTKYSSQGLRVVGISDELSTNVRAFVADQKLPYTIGRDDGSMEHAYFVTGIPEVVVIDKQGVVRYVDVAGDLDDLDAVLAKLL